MSRFLLCIFSVFILSSIFLAYQNKSGKINDINKSPVIVFKESCSRCHGNEGSTFGKTFGHLNDNSLREKVEDMMFGPAFLEPDSHEVDAMLAYNKNIRDAKPFAIVLNAASFLEGRTDTLLINVSKGAIINSSCEVYSEQASDNWKISFNKEKVKNITFTIVKESSSSVLNFPDEIWSK